MGALYTGRGPVCGMIMRGGGAIGAAGRVGAILGLCICITLLDAVEGGAGGEALTPCAAGVVTRGGTAIAGGAAGITADGGAATGVGGTFGGITTTDGGRCCAATEAGVTIRGGGAGVSTTDFGGGTAFGPVGTAAVSTFASTAGGAAGGLANGRGAGCSATPFCCVIARSTSPGREIFDKSILVLMPSSPL